MKSAIILGGGISGCVTARELTDKGFEVNLIEKANHLGGGCYTHFYGGHPYTEGPRPLSVDTDRIFNYINDIVPLRTFPMMVDTYVEKDKRFYSFPIHWDDIQSMPDKDAIMKELSERPKTNSADNLEDWWLNEVGNILYTKYIKHYTQKMWDVKSNRVFPASSSSWSIKGAPMQKGDRVAEMFPGTKLNSYPIEETGYNRFFDYCVKDAKVFLGCEPYQIDLENKSVYLDKDTSIKGDIIISTISLDDLMGNAYGKLKYVGRDFHPIVLPTEHIFPEGHQYLYYAGQEKYTRIVEYKTLTKHNSPDTLIVVEVPSDNGKLYPYDFPEEKEKAKKYMNDLPKDVYSIGRLGTYTYICMGECMEMVWDLMEKL